MVTLKKNTIDIKSISILAWIIVTATYPIILLKSSNIYVQNTSSFVYILITLYGILNLYRLKLRPLKSLLLCFLLQLILIVSFSIDHNYSKSQLWVSDSVQTHVVEANKVKTSLHNSNFLSHTYSRPGRTTHTLTGIFFSIFETSPFISSVAQLLLKLVTSIILYHSITSIINTNTALLSVLLYNFMPVQLFHTTVLYKESAVHFGISLFVAAIAFLKSKRLLSSFLLFSISILQLKHERFYISASLISSIPFIFYMYRPQTLKNKLIIIIGLLISSALALSTFNDIPNITWFFNKMKELRESYSSLPGINYALNYEIPYPLAFIKLYFSPHFSFNKFSMFLGYSSIITSGTLFNYFFMIFALIGNAKLIKTNHRLGLLLTMPLLFFLVIAAYISPWSFRLKDSFHPIFCMFSSIGIFYFKNLAGDKLNKFLS